MNSQLATTHFNYSSEHLIFGKNERSLFHLSKLQCGFTLSQQGQMDHLLISASDDDTRNYLYSFTESYILITLLLSSVAHHLPTMDLTAVSV